MDHQKQYRKEAEPRLKKMRVLGPLCGWEKIRPTQKELFMRREFMRLRTAQDQAEIAFINEERKESRIVDDYEEQKNTL